MLRIGDRDGWICWICHAPVEQTLPFDHPMHASLDHKIPRVLGGSSRDDNLAISHHRCNHEREKQRPRRVADADDLDD